MEEDVCCRKRPGEFCSDKEHAQVVATVTNVDVPMMGLFLLRTLAAHA